VFKITQSRYNLRLLYYIKSKLGVGTVTKDKTKGQILIRDRKKIAKFILPIFDKYPLLTSKEFNYEKFKEAFYILEDSSLSKEEKDDKLFFLKNKEVYPNYISPE
jgi:LAGLIDADG endonuclease